MGKITILYILTQNSQFTDTTPLQPPPFF